MSGSVSYLRKYLDFSQSCEVSGVFWKRILVLAVQYTFVFFFPQKKYRLIVIFFLRKLHILCIILLKKKNRWGFIPMLELPLVVVVFFLMASTLFWELLALLGFIRVFTLLCISYVNAGAFPSFLVSQNWYTCTRLSAARWGSACLLAVKRGAGYTSENAVVAVLVSYL